MAYLAPESPWNAVRRGEIETARKSIARLRSADLNSEEVGAALAYIQHITRLETAEVMGASFLDCFKGTNLRRTEINCVVWAAQILCGNAILGYSVVFLQAAGFGETQALDLNIALSACYIVGGVICWFRECQCADGNLTYSLPKSGQSYDIHVWVGDHVHCPGSHRRPCLQQHARDQHCHRSALHLPDLGQHVYSRTGVLPNRR